jgi:lipoyl(octanoyl) transferase
VCGAVTGAPTPGIPAAGVPASSYTASCAAHEPRRTPASLPVLDLGIAPYEPTQRLQARLREAVADGVLPGVILLLEHEPVITLGNRRTPADLRDLAAIRERGVEVALSERGGQATLHAPGQLVSYPLVPVPRRDLRAFVHDLEEVLRVLLAGLGIAAHRRDRHPGLYVAGDKIASIGLRCRRWVSSHGTSLNVNIDLSLFDLLVSCGEPELRQTGVQALTGRTYDMDEIKARYLAAAQQVFGWDLCPPRALTLHEVEGALGLHELESVTESAGEAAPEGGMPTAGFEPATPGSGGQCSIP